MPYPLLITLSAALAAARFAYSNAQAAWGRVYNSVGLDVLPETIDSNDVKTLAGAMASTMQEWQSLVFKSAAK